MGPSQKKVSQPQNRKYHLDRFRPQALFRSGQDNQEPIYDFSGVKMGADFGSP
jgi:hypothetical protein